MRPAPPDRAHPRTDVALCRGCCCGTDRKHPDIDHALQGAQLREAAESTGGTLRHTGCLGPCDRSNVVVVRPEGQRPVWFGRMLDERMNRALVTWIARGATGPFPAELVSRRFQPGGDHEAGLDEACGELVLLLPEAKASQTDPTAR